MNDIRLWVPGTLLFLAAACVGRSGSFQAHTTISGSTGEDVEWLVEDGGIAVLVDGEVRGVAGLDRVPNLASWWPEGRLRDHPRLAEMRAAVERFARDANSDSDLGLDAPLDDWLKDLAAVPFGRFRARALVGWVRGDPERAAAVLDVAGFLELGTPAAGLIPLALGAADLTDGRLAEWASVEAVRGDADAGRALGRAASAGMATRSVLLRSIEDFPYSERAPILIELGRPLVAAPEAGRQLALSLDDVNFTRRGEVALAWLGAGDVSTVLAFALLGDIDEFQTGVRIDVFNALAERLATEPGGPEALAGKLDDLYGDAHLAGALALVSSPVNAARQSAAVLAHADDFYGESLVRLLEEIVDGPGYAGANQRACVRTAMDELGMKRRDAVFGRILNSPRTELATRRGVELLMGPAGR